MPVKQDVISELYCLDLWQILHNLSFINSTSFICYSSYADCKSLRTECILNYGDITVFYSQEIFTSLSF